MGQDRDQYSLWYGSVQCPPLKTMTAVHSDLPSGFLPPSSLIVSCFFTLHIRPVNLRQQISSYGNLLDLGATRSALGVHWLHWTSVTLQPAWPLEAPKVRKCKSLIVASLAWFRSSSGLACVTIFWVLWLHLNWNKFGMSVCEPFGFPGTSTFFQKRKLQDVRSLCSHFNVVPKHFAQHNPPQI